MILKSQDRVASGIAGPRILNIPTLAQGFAGPTPQLPFALIVAQIWLLCDSSPSPCLGHITVIV